MSLLYSGAATLPKGFRFGGDECDPRTPEPSAPVDTTRPPSPPRPRLKLKRRNVSTPLHAPTQQFLASVAAADVPIPSVEESGLARADHSMTHSLPRIHLPGFDGMDMYGNLRPRVFSPPKTPAVESAPTLPATEFPDWSIEACWSSSDVDSSPDYESSRPSTAFSTQTSASSFFSRFSVASDGGEDCISLELDQPCAENPAAQEDQHKPRARKSRKAPWTKAMSAHLWSIYLLYLQDPRVTPFRLGKSRIPPEGVCARVAREARRSWKGSNISTRSGSSTPTAESSKPYMQWPHTCAATRAHLRELCKLEASFQAGKSAGIARSPTPFNKAAHRRWNRRCTPARSQPAFSGQDMAMSLTLCTAEAMQPHGPLAQLTSAQSGTTEQLESDTPVQSGAQRLGSPFPAHNYGPSSSSTLDPDVKVGRSSTMVGAHNGLQSPVRLTRSRSGTQKRRSVKGAEEPRSRRRPSLAAAFSSTDSAGQGDLFVPRTAPLADPFAPTGPLDVPPTPPRRLGSPFPGSNASRSFPDRLQPAEFNLTALRRGFATVQQYAEPTRPSDAAPAPRSSLASRLAYIDERLKEFRGRSNVSRRSQSPC